MSPIRRLALRHRPLCAGNRDRSSELSLCEGPRLRFSGVHLTPLARRDLCAQNLTGSAVLPMTAPAPTTVYQYKDQDAYSLNVRVQRNF